MLVYRTVRGVGVQFTSPPETVTARRISGRLVAQFSARNFDRELRELVVSCSVSSRVDVYRDIISTVSRIAQNPIGEDNTLNPSNRQIIKAGSVMYVTWDEATGVTDTASATATFEGYM